MKLLHSVTSSLAVITRHPPKGDEMTKWGIFTIAGAIALVPQAASAIDCMGTVDRSYVTSDGDVIIRGTWRNDYTKICNIKGEWQGVTPDVCVGVDDPPIETDFTTG